MLLILLLCAKYTRTKHANNLFGLKVHLNLQRERWGSSTKLHAQGVLYENCLVYLQICHNKFECGPGSGFGSIIRESLWQTIVANGMPPRSLSKSPTRQSSQTPRHAGTNKRLLRFIRKFDRIVHVSGHACVGVTVLLSYREMQGLLEAVNCHATSFGMSTSVSAISACDVIYICDICDVSIHTYGASPSHPAWW